MKKAIGKIKKHYLFIKYKKYVRFLFFCIVGGMSALIHFSAFNLFRFWAMLGFSVSLIAAIGISMIFNFSVNRNITFSARGRSIKKQLPKYLLVYILSMSANFLIASYVRSILGSGFLRENLALLSGLAVSIPANFFGSLFWAFKK